MKWIKKILVAISIVLLAALFVLYKSDIPAETIRMNYADTTSQFLPLMGMQVHFRDQGNQSDTVPLVLIHGLSSSLHTWDSLVVRLKENRRIIRLDLPAFGLTGASPEGEYSWDYYNRFVDSFLTVLKIKQCILVGHSLGGYVAWNQAIYKPQRLVKLILINSGGYPRKNEKGNIGFKLASIPIVGNIITKFTPKKLIKKSLEDAYADDSKINDALVDRHFNLLLREGNRKATIDFFRQRATPLPEKIKLVQVPTLIIWGEDDQMIDVSNAYKFQTDIKESKLKIISHSGHVPMEESPEAVFQAIIDYIQLK
ncbi:MAG: 2-hydroxymuconate semialdehyde hydrolase [Bacteroidota bacterium]|jgi:pimeloyl-ACP methyl ester carboxylesterase